MVSASVGGRGGKREQDKTAKQRLRRPGLTSALARHICPRPGRPTATGVSLSHPTTELPPPMLLRLTCRSTHNNNTHSVRRGLEQEWQGKRTLSPSQKHVHARQSGKKQRLYLPVVVSTEDGGWTGREARQARLPTATLLLFLLLRGLSLPFPPQSYHLYIDCLRRLPFCVSSTACTS